MANSAGNVIVGQPLATGGALNAPVGTALPTDEKTTLNAAFVAVGYVTDDGVTKTEDRDSDTIKGWGGDTIASVQKSFGVSLKLSLAEFLNARVQQLMYGAAAVTVTPATSSAGTKVAVAVGAAPAPHNSWVFEIVSGVKKLRIVIPDGQITATGDVSYKDDDIAANEVTITCFPDVNGKYFYTYSDNGVFSV